MLPGVLGPGPLRCKAFFVGDISPYRSSSSWTVRKASREDVGGVDHVDESAPEFVSLTKLAVFVSYVDDGPERAPGKD
jgi:hypothetical protein